MAWAWFAGMAFFLVMFRYGMLAAVLVHAVYNYMVFALGTIASRFVTPIWPTAYEY